MLRALLLLAVVSGCSSAEKERIERSILLTIDNQTGGQLWYFDYSECGADDWYYVIADDEYVANGDLVSSSDLDPGCYDVYVEDEYACSAQTSSGNVGPGEEWTWTLRSDQLDCYGLF